MSKAIPLRLDAPLLERIRLLSEKIGEPQSTIMRMALRVGLDQVAKAFASDQGASNSGTDLTPGAQVVDILKRSAARASRRK